MRKIAISVARSTRRLGTQIPSGILYPVAAGLILLAVAAWLHHGHAPPLFFRRVDANVTEAGGAGVFESADDRHKPVQRIKRSHGQEFIGFCIGESVRSVSTHLPDDIWFVLVNHRLVAAAMMDGNPLSGRPPIRCAGGIAGPAEVVLNGVDPRHDLTLHATAPGATLVGFAVRKPGAFQWVHLGLVASAKGTFTEQARVGGPLVAIAVACWARGAPALTTDAHEYVHEIWGPDAPSELLTEATSTISDAAHAACSPGAHTPSKANNHANSLSIKRSSVGPAGAGTTSVTRPQYPQTRVPGVQLNGTSTAQREASHPRTAKPKPSSESELRGSPAPSK
jgi:hypothetical protein